MDAKVVSTALSILLASIAALYWLFSLEANATVQETKIKDLTEHITLMNKQFTSINDKLDTLNSNVSYIKGRLEKK